MLPPIPARIAIILGFLVGTWTLVDGFEKLITGDYLRIHGQLGPWATLVSRVGLDPNHFGLVLVGFGALWMAAGNYYLLTNGRAAWRCMVLLTVLTLWYVGFATPVLIAQVILLGLPKTRAALAG